MNWYMQVLRSYATFEGRARRKEYWMFALVNLIIFLVLEAVSMMLLKSAPKASFAVTVILFVYSLLVLLPSIAVLVRRLHDTNRSGAWFWIALVPFVGAIVLLVFAVIDGTPTENDYGPSPKTMSL